MYFLVKIHNIQIFTIKLLSRYICINTVKHSISKQGYIINKFIMRNQTKRDPIELIINTSPHEASKKELSVHTRRRMTVLNKVFMEHITDMMSTGEIEPEILNRNIEISQIKITADFKFLNIYWIDNSEEQSDIEELLQKCAFKLRHELSQLRIIGNVPPIQFVRDKNIRKLKEVNQKLKTLDFGEDFVPNAYPDFIHYTVTANAGFENHEKVKDTQHDNISQDVFNVSVPIMRHDIFGLDHYQIMSKIKVSLNKVQKSHKIPVTNVQIDSTSTPNLDIENVPTFITNGEQQEQFSKFLNQRRKQQRGKNKKTRYNIDEYEIENDCNDFYTDEDNGELYKHVEDEFKKIR